MKLATTVPGQPCFNIGSQRPARCQRIRNGIRLVCGSIEMHAHTQRFRPDRGNEGEDLPSITLDWRGNWNSQYL